MSKSGFAYPRRVEDDHVVVAVGLLSERDLAVLGEGFKRAYRIDEGHDFHELLAAIDAAEQDMRG